MATTKRGLGDHADMLLEMATDLVTMSIAVSIREVLLKACSDQNSPLS